MKSTDPAKYAAFKPWRDGFTDYKSGCLADLKAMARKLLKTSDGSTRTANHDFMEYIERFDKDGKGKVGILEDIMTRCRNAKKRGDATADPDKLAKAIVAFKSIYIG